MQKLPVFNSLSITDGGEVELRAESPNQICMLTTALRDRRSGRRFPLKMSVAYRVFLNRDRQVLGRGKSHTVDISRTGVLLRTRGYYPLGASAELLIEWPAPGENATAVHLRILGAVVRHDERGTAIEILRHGFQGGALRMQSTTGFAGAPREETVDCVAEEPPIRAIAGNRDRRMST
jgi:hypothetical protein